MNSPATTAQEPVLVVDFGSTTSSAILLTADGQRLLREPGTRRDARPTSVYMDQGRLLIGSTANERGADSPSAYRTEFKLDLGSEIPVLLGPPPRTAEDLTVEVLAALRAETALLGPLPSRLLVTVPAQITSRWRDAMLSAGDRAGFTDVELLPEPIAAAFAAATRTRWTPGDHVLIYDLGGGTFDAALIRLGSGPHEICGIAGLAEGHGGRDVDAAIVRDLAPAVEEWISADSRREAHRELLEYQTLRAAISLKQQLTDNPSATALISVGITPQRLDQGRLAELTDGLLADTVACCRSLLAKASLDPADVAGVLLVGGSTQMPTVKPYLERHLKCPVFVTADPVVAVVEGAARWARDAAMRQGLNAPPSRWLVPLRWTLPGSGRATLVRWLADVGDSVAAEATIARVRLDDDSLYDLRTRTPVQVTRRHVRAGQVVDTGAWIVTTLRPPGPGDLLAQPRLEQQWQCVATAMAFSPQGRYLAVASRVSDDASCLRVIRIMTGRDEVHERVQGRIHALAWSPDGANLAFGASDDREQSWTVSAVEGVGVTPSTRRITALRGAVLGLVYLAGGRLAISCGTGSLEVVDLSGFLGRGSTPLSGRPTAMALPPHGQWVAVGGGDSRAGFVDMAGLRGDGILTGLCEPSRVRALAFSPDGRWFAAAGGARGRHGFLTVYKAAGEPGTSWQQHRGGTLDSPHPDPDEGLIRSVALSADGALLAVAADSGLIQIGRPESEEIFWSAHYSGTPIAVAFSPSGHSLAVAGTDGVRLWQLTSIDSERPSQPASAASVPSSPTERDLDHGQ